MRCRYRLILSGNVQGVGLRFRINQYAQEHNLGGWVKNLADGTVAVEMEGEAEEVRAAVAWILSLEGRLTNIDKIVINKIVPQNEVDFKIVK